jgi:death-on-curing protein
MRLLAVSEIISLHATVLAASGGASGIRDLGALKSAAAQPRVTFGGEELYPTLFDKAAALCHSLVLNHPFVDGNKRAGHAALETMLVLNGFELTADADEQERVFLELASGGLSRLDLASWVESVAVPRGDSV